MDKTNYATNGGFGELLDDLTFDQQSVRDAFYGLLSAFGVSIADSFIISGCNLISSVYQPGYISLGGEILKFDGGSCGVSVGHTRVWDVLLTYDSDGDRVLESGGTFQAYQVRKAQIINVLDADAGNYLHLSSAPTLQKLIVEMVAADNANTDLANKILAVIAASGLYASSTALTWNAYTPTFAAYDSSDGAVSSGVTIASFAAFWLISNNTLFIRMSSIDISILTTVRYITMSLPASGLMTGKGKTGTGFCKFSKYATDGSGVPVVVNVDLSSGGSGDPFMLEKADKTDFGALNNYDFRFTITIALV